MSPGSLSYRCTWHSRALSSLLSLFTPHYSSLIIPLHDRSFEVLQRKFQLILQADSSYFHRDVHARRSSEMQRTRDVAQQKEVRSSLDSDVGGLDSNIEVLGRWEGD